MAPVLDFKIMPWRIWVWQFLSPVAVNEYVAQVRQMVHRVPIVASGGVEKDPLLTQRGQGAVKEALRPCEFGREAAQSLPHLRSMQLFEDFFGALGHGTS